MARLLLLAALLSSSAFAQTPNALVQFSDPPEANGASYVLYPRHLLWNTNLQCAQRSTSTGWQCLTTNAETSAAMSSAVSQAGTNAAAIYYPTATANASFGTVNSRLTSLETTTATHTGQISAVTTTANAAATQASVTASVATLNSRIDAVQASIPTVTPDTVCGNTTISGLSIPLAGISSTATLTIPGAIAGYPCVVGNPSFLPLGAKGVCIASAANTVQMRFEAGGLLSSVISVPNGTYRACVLVRP